MHMVDALTEALSVPKPQPISMDYALYALGSARLCVSCGDQEFAIKDFSNLTDGLGDLVRAALTVITGATYADAIFDCEPQRWGLAIQSAGLSDEKVRIARLTIKYGGTGLDQEGYSGLPVWKWVSEPLLEGYVTTDDFARAVQEIGFKVREEFDDSTYREMWGHPCSLEGFPLRGLRALEAALAIPEFRE